MLRFHYKGDASSQMFVTTPLTNFSLQANNLSNLSPKSQHFKIFIPSAKWKAMFVVSDRLWYRLGGLGAQRVTFRGYSMSATHSQPPSTLSSISATCGLRPKYANLLKTLGIWIKRAASFTQFDHNSDEFGARNIYLRPNGSAPVKLEPHQSRSRWREECKISP